MELFFSSIVKIYCLDWITKNTKQPMAKQDLGDIEDFEKKKRGDSGKSTKCGKKNRTHKMRQR